MKHKLLVLAFICVLSLNMFANAEIVDDHKDHVGYTLIKQLYDDCGTAIEELDSQWSTQSVLLQTNINSWTKTVVDQQSLCARRKQALHDTLKEIEQTQHFIDWISARIRANEGRVERLEELRCRANNLYIEGIKNHRLALALIEYLIKEINSVEDVEMLQKSQTMTKLTMFINAYKLGSVSHLLDAPVFAEFKAHLNEQARSTSSQEDDGESDGEWVDASDEASDRGALDEIERDLESESESSSEGGSGSYGSSGSEEGAPRSLGSSDDGECEDDEESHGGHCSHEDGEFDWDKLDEEDDDEDDDDEVDSDDELSDDEDEEDDAPADSGDNAATSSGDNEDSNQVEEEESAPSGASTSHHDVADEEDEDDGEALAELADEDGKHQGDAAQIYGSDYNSEQESSHGSQSGSGVHLDGDVKSWPVYQSEILAVLNELKTHILSTMKQAQDDQVLAGVGLADFKLFIDLENRGLERDLADQQNRREQLAVQQKKNEWAIDHCHAELQTTRDSEYAAKAEHEGTHIQYKENRAAKEAEREIYEYVLGLYEGRINAYNEPHFNSSDFDDLDNNGTDGEDGETDGELRILDHADGEDGEDGEFDGEWVEDQGEDEYEDGEGEWVEEDEEEDLFL